MRESPRLKLAREALERQRTGDYAKTIDDIFPADDIVDLANALRDEIEENEKLRENRRVRLILRLDDIDDRFWLGRLFPVARFYVELQNDAGEKINVEYSGAAMKEDGTILLATNDELRLDFELNDLDDVS